MSILWAGAGEDIDFARIGQLSWDITAGHYRSGWTRGNLTFFGSTSAYGQTWPFNGGPVTSAWLSCRHISSVGGSGAIMMFGFGKSNTASGIGLGILSGVKLTLSKYDGTNRTDLVTENGSSTGNNIFNRFDIQVINYGVSATVNVYLNLVLLMTYTGDITVPGMTNFDCVTVWPDPQGGGGQCNGITEIIVADTDTRAFTGVQSLALTGAGTTNNWTNNTFTNINQAQFTDNTPASSNATGQDQQYNVTDPTPVAFAVAAVVVSARLAKTASSVPTQVKLGYNSGGSVAFGTGAAKTVSTGYQTYQQIDAVNPVTSNPFTSAETIALQLDLQSA